MLGQVLKNAVKYQATMLALTLGPQIYQQAKNMIGNLAQQEGRLGDFARKAQSIGSTLKGMISDTVEETKQAFHEIYSPKVVYASKILNNIGNIIIAQFPSYLQEDAREYLQEFVSNTKQFLQSNPYEIDKLEAQLQTANDQQKLAETLMKGATKINISKNADSNVLQSETSLQHKIDERNINPTLYNKLNEEGDMNSDYIEPIDKNYLTNRI